jgi:carbonic anhydrase
MAAEVLERLKAGIRRFRKDVYPANEDMYQRAGSEPQRPSALIVACADSRIGVEQITQSRTGEIFITRNIGNLVPAYGEMLGGVSAVVEYAVSWLGVKHIAVCGHSECGAMNGLLDPEAMAKMPTVENWLKNAHAALTVTQAMAEPEESPSELRRRLTEENVLLQLKHLQTHPSVAAAMARRELTISGWVYDIASGEVKIHEWGKDGFEPVVIEAGRASSWERPSEG